MNKIIMNKKESIKQKLDEVQKLNEQDMTRMIVQISWAIIVGIIIVCRDIIGTWSDFAKCSVFFMFFTSLISISAELLSCENFKKSSEYLNKFLSTENDSDREKGFIFENRGNCCVCVRNKLFYLSMFFLTIFILILLSRNG